jgi:hypothetical protein
VRNNLKILRTKKLNFLLYRTLPFDAWVDKANNILEESLAANLNAKNLTMAITETIDHLSNNVSKQIMKTHEVAKNQIEADMKAQGVLATHQKDVSFFIIL